MSDSWAAGSFRLRQEEPRSCSPTDPRSAGYWWGAAAPLETENTNRKSEPLMSEPALTDSQSWETMRRKCSDGSSPAAGFCVEHVWVDYMSEQVSLFEFKLQLSSRHNNRTCRFLTTHSCSLDSSVYLFKTSTPINVCFSFLESELTFSNVLFFDHNPKRFCSRPENWKCDGLQNLIRGSVWSLCVQWLYSQHILGKTADYVWVDQRHPLRSVKRFPRQKVLQFLLFQQNLSGILNVWFC